jgi:5-methyltetrahydropteroyltriglutamate--homocysteine methyltransferase
MYKASAGITLPTSIIGSLPRPSWYSAGLGSQSFLEAMMNLRYREQYEDAVSVYLRAQETAGLDICTDGDAHFDEQISGMSWQSYPLTHMAGFSTTAEPSAYQLASGAPRGHTLHDFLEARVLPKIVGPVGPGNLHYAAVWKVAQRLTKRPVKFGTILPELLAASVADEYYKDPVERVWAISDALNSELGELADAGCPAIQLEEPQIHMVPVRGKPFGKLDRRTRRTLQQHSQGTARQDRGLVPHLLGQPLAAADLPGCAELSADIGRTQRGRCRRITFETCSSGTGDLEAIGEIVKDKKIVIGVIDHHTLQVERPDQVADLIREALKYIPPERLIISSDCGMGREGMSRRHATYKMVAMVLGTNIVRKELGLPEAECLAADPRFSLARNP